MPEHESDTSFEDESPINSLQAELSRVAAMIKQLDDFKPETKTTRGKAKANPEGSQQKNQSNKITSTTTLNLLCSLTQKILDQLVVVHEENTSLKSRVTALEDKPSSNRSSQSSYPSTFAAVVSGKNVPAPQAINLIDCRLDQVEQRSLADTLKLQGDLITTEIIEDGAASDELDKFVADAINRVKPNTVKRQSILSVTVVGRERKHLKVKFSSLDYKIKVLKAIKEKKPEDIYASQYLTRSRAHSLYRLKKIKQSNPEIVSSLYCYGGSICCKLFNSEQIHYLNTSSAIDSFVSKHRIVESDE